MRTLTKILMILALVSSSLIVSAPPSSAHQIVIWDYLENGCLYKIGHEKNMFGYPVSYSEHHNSKCGYWKNTTLWSRSYTTVRDYDDSGSRYRPAVAVGPFGWTPSNSGHKVCPVNHWEPCDNIYL